MLSRANSDAASRLRRAKSSSSIQPKHHELQPLAIHRKHAELAAIEAYRRAQNQDEILQQLQPSVKPERRRSRKSGPSEGSHFQDSRQGNRLSASTSGGPSRSNSTKLTHRNPTTMKFEDGEERIVTRPRRVVDTNSTTATKTNRNIQSNMSSAGPSVRDLKTKSMYTLNSSSASQSQYSTSAAPRRYSVFPDTPYRSAIDSAKSAHTSSTPSSDQPVIPTIREKQTDEMVRAHAYDAYLQDFHQRKVREGKSFIAPIKKRLVKDKDRALPNTTFYDSSVPPYNLASESDDVFSSPPMPPVEALEAMEALPVTKNKSRTVSDSLKNRIKRMLGTSKRVQSALPAQHVEAKTLHLQINPRKPDSTSPHMFLFPGLATSLPGTARSRQISTKRVDSGGDAATVKSRVTSWTSSTAAGTVRSSQGQGLAAIHESAVTANPDVAPRKQHGSFLGRALRIPLRRGSQTELNRSSKDSQQLYNALCKRIEDPQMSLYDEGRTNSGSHLNQSELSTAGVSSSSTHTALDDSAIGMPSVSKTIRAVSPDLHDSGVSAKEFLDPPSRLAPQAPAVVVRKASWWKPGRKSSPAESMPQNHDRGSLHNTHGLDASVISPSQQQIAQRVERVETRWQSALEHESPVLSRAMQYTMNEDDPYRLRSIVASPVDDYLPVAVRHNHPRLQNMEAELSPSVAISRTQQLNSPSVYSRTTDCRSVTPMDTSEGHSMFVTITGREVKRYSLDSPAKSSNATSYPLQPSHEWKSWLNKELADLNTTPAPDDFTLSGQSYFRELNFSPAQVPIDTSHYRENAQKFNSSEAISTSRIDVVTPPPIRASKTRRPQLDTRRSSMMNDRYPMIETGSGSDNDRELKARHGITPPEKRSFSNTASVSTGPTPPTATVLRLYEDEKQDFVKTTNTRPRIRERHSAAVLSTVSRPRSSLTKGALQGAEAVGSREEGGYTATAKPKSALDLRAVYRSNHAVGGGSNINIRRKPMPTPLHEDQTLQKISEGPYASDVTANKENTMPRTASSVVDSNKFRYNIDGPTLPPTRLSPSPGLTRGPRATRGKESPGQRMVDDFLNSRKGNAESSPAAGPAFI